jgi:hypothetical protein
MNCFAASFEAFFGSAVYQSGLNVICKRSSRFPQRVKPLRSAPSSVWSY